MGRFTAFLISRFRAWDSPSQIAFIVAILLLIPAAIVANSGPEDLQTPATIGTIGLVMSLQAIFMWANRTMVTPFSRAQRAYRKGEFQQAREILETLYQNGEDDVQTMTLLGNTYRQLGMLSESYAILFEARNKYNEHYFSLYGFGRTLLVQGHYAEAAETMAQALEFGAQPAIHTDVAEAFYHAGNTEKCLEHLELAEEHIQLEPHRLLMNTYLQQRLEQGHTLDADVFQNGIEYWQAQAERFSETPYGVALQDDLKHMRLMLTKEKG